MANEAAIENINVAEILGSEKAELAMQEVEQAINADPEASALMKAAQTVEDVYEIVKRYAKATLEQVKYIFNETVDYFKEAKAVLADEVLDNVVGGGFLSWWKENKAKVIFGVVAVACTVAGLAIGAATFGLGGAVVGLGVGAIVGLVGGMAAGKAVED